MTISHDCVDVCAGIHQRQYASLMSYISGNVEWRDAILTCNIHTRAPLDELHDSRRVTSLSSQVQSCII